jgi:hypothetical protein
MLLPMLARAKAAAQKATCMNNLKQLGTGVTVYADDHAQVFCPALLDDAAADGFGLTWDIWIDRYIGGTLQLSGNDANGNLANLMGGQEVNEVPKVLRCPADTGVNTAWGPGTDSWLARRSYAINAAGYEVPTYRNIYCNPPYYPTPPQVHQGIGLWWTMASAHYIDWDCPGYPTRVIQDPSGTILFAELCTGDNFAGNAWCAAVLGPTNSNADAGADPDADLFQLNSQGTDNHGGTVYQAHGYKFDYIFHDNHVSSLSWQQTLGTGTTWGAVQTPPVLAGMWTIKAGD